jgi:UDP-N-acetylmuramyl pentapeptide phosphotransferase/UDP-N-acetylglucosamine-1-phosphate transferase
MTQLWVYFIIAALLVAAELVYFKVADHFNIIDKPNQRSSHSKVTLLGGGIIFLFGAWLWAAFFGLQYPWFMGGLTLIALVSFIDDVHSVSNKIRLLVQFLAMFLMFHELGILQWNMWWMVLIAWVVCVGITNAYNFMDGINGITGAYSLSVLLPLICVNAKTPFVDMPLLVVTTMAVMVFCFFNFRKKAKCFAGDVGAIGIAFILIFALGKLVVMENDLTYIVFFTVYGVDTVLTICHRILLHEHLGEAHRKHAYQLMANELGIPHVIVSTLYMVMQLLISFGMILLPMKHWIYMCIVFAIFGSAYLLFMWKYYHLHEEYLKSQQDEKQAAPS